MIRPEDFAVEIRKADTGSLVRVTHKPTGSERVAESVVSDAVGRTRDSFIAQLRRLLFDPEEIRMDTGRAEGGDFIRVVHTPSGIERWAKRRESTHEELLDQVLEELHSGQAGGSSLMSLRPLGSSAKDDLPGRHDW